MKDKVLVGLFFAAVFISFLGPINDPDFPFHLKTGQYIYQHKEIPEDDPFSFYGEGVVTERERFTLSQYWIAQILFYKLYSIAGPAGIILLRAAVFSSFIFLLWAVLRKRGLYSSLIIASLTVIMLQAASTDRPQYFSFLFTLVLVLLLERFRQKPESYAPLLFMPPLMLLWANMHAGFVFGLAVLVIYTFTETAKRFVNKLFFGRPLMQGAVLILAVTTLVSILLSYVNPAFNEQILTTLESHVDKEYVNRIYGTNREYISPIREMSIFFGNRTSSVIFFCLFGFVSVISALNVARTRSFDATISALVVFSAVAAFSAVRYIPFFVAIALPLSGQYRFFESSAFLDKIKKTDLMRILLGIFFLCAIAFGLRDYSRLLTYDKSGYPEQAAQFLLKNRIDANIFNQFNKGSYLLWRLYPHYRLFNDTRFISLDAVIDTDAIANASSVQGEPLNIGMGLALSDLVPEELGGINILPDSYYEPQKQIPHWKKMLDQYNINLIVHEACNQFTKEIYPLVLRLIKDDEWVLVYLDGQMLIFVRNTEKYFDMIEKHKLPKTYIYDEIILETAPLVSRTPTISAPYASLAFAYAMKGQDEKAKGMIDAAIELNSNDIVAHFSKAYLALKQRAQEKAAAIH